MASFAKKMPNHGTFDVEINLAKDIFFTKIGLANGAILKLRAAHPYPKFCQDTLDQNQESLEVFRQSYLILSPPLERN